MPNEIILVLYFFMWYLLVGLALFFIISGADDLFFDGYYWTRYFWRFWKTRHYEPLTYEKLTSKEEQLIAVLIPCWQEKSIISLMLQHNFYAIDYKNYYFFVGLYPNDLETIAEVQGIASQNERVQYVIGETPGPTNKASNLNTIYQAIKAFEKNLGKSFDIFVFHDSEDMIHSLSFKLYNYLIPRKDMIQIPIFPLKVNYWNFTHWLYADEFAENHTKDIVVREAIGAHVPSAGVGTAFSKFALTTLEDPKTALPFSTNSLAEDYRTSLALRVHQLKQIFVTQHIIRMQWKKRYIFGCKYVQKPVKEIVAIRALFPLEYTKSIRQKARWIIGIVFQEWQHSRWPKERSVRYTLAHDRKSSVTHLINGLGYLVFAFWVLYSFMTYATPEYPTLQERFNAHPWVWWLIVSSTLIMCERLLQRTIATYRIYGLIPASLVVPRAFYGNILNLHALLRAYRIYFRAPSLPTTHKQPSWDKTENSFQGGHILAPYRKKLGDLLKETQNIDDEQLNHAIFLQQKTGERLGQVLCRLEIITPLQLLHVLSSQYNLPLFPQTEIQNAKAQCLSKLSKKTMRWLNRRGLSPVAVDESEKIVTIAIDDPTNEPLLAQILHYLMPYHTKFVLIHQEIEP